MMGYVYILLLESGSYYIGSTDNVFRRINEHNSGHVRSTKHKRPLKLLFTKEYKLLSIARKVEYKIKSTKKRAYVEKFMRGEYNPIKTD